MLPSLFVKSMYLRVLNGFLLERKLGCVFAMQVDSPPPTSYDTFYVQSYI